MWAQATSMSQGRAADVSQIGSSREALIRKDPYAGLSSKLPSTLERPLIGYQNAERKSALAVKSVGLRRARKSGPWNRRVP